MLVRNVCVLMLRVLLCVACFCAFMECVAYHASCMVCGRLPLLDACADPSVDPTRLFVRSFVFLYVPMA